MNHLLEKSKENLISAKLLIDSGFYNSSLHCAYYSCLQLIKYVLIEFHDYYEFDFDNDSTKNKGGTHKYIIGSLTTAISINITAQKANRYKEDLNKVKLRREEIDYFPQKIIKTEDEASKVYQKCAEIHIELIKIYNL